MPITLGLYDFFSYIIPGILYLYVFNQFLRVLNWSHIDIGSWFQSNQLPNLMLLILILVASFIAGHVFDPVAHKFYDFISRFRQRQTIPERSLASIKDKYPDLDIRFEPEDSTILLTFIRLRNIDMSKFIDKYSADAIMLRNVAFSLLLLAINYFLVFFLSGKWQFLLIGLPIMLLSILAISRSNDFRSRFLRHIYRTSLEYGCSVKEVVDYGKNKKHQAKNTKRNTSKLPLKKL